MQLNLVVASSKILYPPARLHDVTARKIGISTLPCCGSGSVVGIATGYGLDGPGIECRWRRDFPHLRSLGPPSLLCNGYWVFPGGKERPVRDANQSLSSRAVVIKSRAIRLLPLWTLRPLQSLSVSTRVHFTFTLPCTLKDNFLKQDSTSSLPNFSHVTEHNHPWQTPVVDISFLL
jgi:hypothetical protein